MNQPNKTTKPPIGPRPDYIVEMQAARLAMGWREAMGQWVDNETGKPSGFRVSGGIATADSWAPISHPGDFVGLVEVLGYFKFGETSNAVFMQYNQDFRYMDGRFWWHLFTKPLMRRAFLAALVAADG